jgi:hypothetical protein
MARTTCLVCLISTVSGHSKRKEKNQKCGASSRRITNLKQSILSFDIYGHNAAQGVKAITAFAIVAEMFA